MTLRSAFFFASASLLAVACDEAETNAVSRSEGASSTARMGDSLLNEDLPVFGGEDWGGGQDHEVEQTLLLDGREVEDVGFLAQLNPFGDPTLYVYDAAAFPDAACAKGFSRRSVPDFAPGEGTANSPVEVPVLRLRYQSKTGDWTGETVTLVDNGSVVSAEDAVGGVVEVHETEVPQAVGETLVLEVTFMEIPSVFFPDTPPLADRNPGQPWVGPTDLIEGPVPGLGLGEDLAFAEGPARDYELNGGRTWADLSVDLDVTCSSER